MRGNSLSFFKPPVFGKTVLIFCALFLVLLFNSCKQLASFDPAVDGARVVINNTLSAPTWNGNGVTNGLKRKISLEWIPVSGAKYYDIYCADSATAEFKKVGETVKNSFDDNVGAGRTLYYKVCAVKSNGVQSAFSAIRKGTSLAQPVISGGEVNANDATISWFMENARGVDGMDNYEGSLIFEVCYQPKNGGAEIPKIIHATEFANSSYEYTFEGLTGSTEYQFYVKAYLSGDQQNVEQSPKVTKETLTSYMPAAPEFTASQGDSAKGILLSIKLPEWVMVNTATKDNSEEHDEQYPLCFKVERQSEGEGTWTVAVDPLYYNGTTVAPGKDDYLDADKGYVAGKTITWFDAGADLQGGVKYTYRIRSFVDVGYSDVVNSNFKDTNRGTSETLAHTNVGWKSAHPAFKITYPEGGGKTLSDDGTKVCSVTFGFHAEWNDLGVADKYKFAIQQNRKNLGADSSASGTDTWLTNKDGSDFFATLAEVNEHAVTFGSKENGLSEDDKGIYSYTLYIIPKSETVVTDDESIVLDSTKAIDEIQVTPDAELPEAELTVKDGYKDKVFLTVAIVKPGEKYKVVRTRLENGRPIEDSRSEFVLIIPDAANVEGGTFVYEDTDVQTNCTYSYILKAEATSGAYYSTLSQEAETLGTPTVSFEREKLSYDSVTISFGGVLAAEKYVVQLGAAGSFGNGETFEITKDENGEWKTGENAVTGSQGASADVAFAANKFTVTMKKPHGYDDATLAGIAADATVTAHSAVDNATSAAVAVNVVGPALLEAQVVGETTEDSISLSWKAVEGAKGYLVRRVMYDDAGMSNVLEFSDVTYYCDVSGNSIKVALADGGAVGDRVTVEQLDGDVFRLTDTYKEVENTTDPDIETYQKAQAKISWGLPFRYVVLPVLSKGDFEFKSNSLELENGGKVAYTNLGKTDPAATYGYGLNLVAAKAESGTTQELQWDKPYKSQRPEFYRRPAGTTGKFTILDAVSADIGDDGKTANVKIVGSDRYDAFEYIVKYYPENAANKETQFDLPPSLLEEIKKDTDSYVTPAGTFAEQRNKGYLLALSGFNARVHPTKKYYEQVLWNMWDYKTRAVGPDKMEIYVQNNNISAVSEPILTVEKARANDGVTINGEDIKAEAEEQNFICVAPKGIAEGTSGTTDGLLKVLRDYKHNYTFKLLRKVSEADTGVPSSDYEDDYIKTAYRQITDEELVKTTMLIIAEVVQYSGIESKGAGGGATLKGKDGEFELYSGSDSKLNWYIRNYSHKWNDKPSTSIDTSYIILSDPNPNGNRCGRKYSNYIRFLCFDETSKFDANKLISIDITSAVPLDSYKGTVKFAADPNNFSAKVSRNGAETTVATIVNNKEKTKQWCPINLDEKDVVNELNGYQGKNPAYGWWPSSN